MNKLFIEDKNKISVPVAELGLILNKEQAIIGNAERDLILRTAGNIKIQVNNKFYDLPINTEGSQTVLGGVIIVNTKAELNALTYPGDGSLIYLTSDKSFYIAYGSVYVKINGASSTPTGNIIYLAYDRSQNLNGTNKQQVSLNIGNLIADIQDVYTYASQDVYEGMIVFSIKDSKHFQLTDIENPQDVVSWKELYVSTAGGTTNNLIIDSTTNGNLQITGDYLYNYLSPSETEFKGLYLGLDYNKGLAIWNNDNTSFISTQNLDNGIIRFITGGSNSTPNNPFSITNKNVGVGYIDYSYMFNVGGTSSFKNSVYITNELLSKDFITGVNGKGTSLYKDMYDKWTLEVDNILVRNQTAATHEYKTNPLDGALFLNFAVKVKTAQVIEEIEVYANATKVGRYNSAGVEIPLTSRGTHVSVVSTDPSIFYENETNSDYNLLELAYGVGDKASDGTLISDVFYNKDDTDILYIPQGEYSYDPVNKVHIEDPAGTLVNISRINLMVIEFNVNNTMFEIGDLLYTRYWDQNKNEINTVYAEVVGTIDNEVLVYVYNNTIDEGLELIKVANKFTQECFIQLNSADLNEPYIEMNTDITSFNDFLKNIYWDAELVELGTQFNKTQTRFILGDLSKIEDINLGLTLNNLEKGVYSDNAYFKGNFESIKHIMGDQLSFISGVLTIADLEIIKSRNITGADGLTGGGNLFANDIIIKHGASNWVNKTNLTGNTVISNFVFDEYGHITNWVTREITTGGGETTAAVWGEITGTLTDQIDLNDALNLKQNKITFTTTAATEPTFDIATSALNIPPSQETLKTVVERGNDAFRTIRVKSDNSILYLGSTYLTINNSASGNSMSLQPDSLTLQSNGSGTTQLTISQTPGNKVHILPNTSGTLALVSDIRAIQIFVQLTQPTGGTYYNGDIWLIE